LIVVARKALFMLPFRSFLEMNR